MKKFLYMAVISASLILSSCSMQKDAGMVNLQSEKLMSGQQISKANIEKQQMNQINVPVNGSALTYGMKSDKISMIEKTSVTGKSFTRGFYHKTASVRPDQIGNGSTVKVADKNTDSKKAPQVAHKKSGSGKSQLIALLLCIFVGGLGIHRFYLGYIGIGILELLTAGVFGILWLIDLIRIITGDLKPKDGEYDTKL
jgi:TM2 domain-containing membrane protein YozV